MATSAGRSVARVWDDQTLELIRQVVPAPTVHARNLFHVSAAMWDAWAAYDETADGLFVTEKLRADQPDAAREIAMSYAAYRILLWRYGTVSDLPAATEQLTATMDSLCYRTDSRLDRRRQPGALGNRIARGGDRVRPAGRRARGGAVRGPDLRAESTSRWWSPSPGPS